MEFDDASHALPIQCADRVNALLLSPLTAPDRPLEPAHWPLNERWSWC